MLLRSLPEEYERYIEPFAGSACLYLAQKNRTGLINDLNEELINCYIQVTIDPGAVHAILSGLETTPESYYRWRSINPLSLDSRARAARFMLLNRLCFNGVYRTDKQGRFNVPIGKNQGRIPPESLFTTFAESMSQVVLSSLDFHDLIMGVKRGDFVYLDPPYVSHQRKVYGEYGPKSFTSRDIERLMESLRYIDSVGAKFLLSYALDDVVISAMCSSWHIYKYNVRRHVAGFHSFRAEVGEILVSNYATPFQS